jgi:hypothetical protein
MGLRSVFAYMDVLVQLEGRGLSRRGGCAAARCSRRACLPLADASGESRQRVWQRDFTHGPDLFRVFPRRPARLARGKPVRTHGRCRRFCFVCFMRRRSGPRACRSGSKLPVTGPARGCRDAAPARGRARRGTTRCTLIERSPRQAAPVLRAVPVPASPRPAYDRRLPASCTQWFPRTRRPIRGGTRS